MTNEEIRLLKILKILSRTIDLIQEIAREIKLDAEPHDEDAFKVTISKKPGKNGFNGN